MDKQGDAAKALAIEWIDRILRHRKWSATELARQARIAPSTILRLMNDPAHEFVPSMKTLGRVSAASGMSVPRKVLDAVRAKALGPDEKTSRGYPNRHNARTELRTVELKYFTSLPAALRTSPQRAAKVRIPDQLKADLTIFAFHMFNDDLHPVIRSGSLIFATKRRDPSKGDTVLVSDRAGRSRVRFLVDISEAGLTLSRSLPVKEEDRISFDDIAELAIVAGCILEI